MAEYRLYCFGESGNSYEAALMLALTGCDWEPRPVAYFDGETRGAAFRETVNEQGEVSVLEHGGRRLSQSGAILTWLAERTGRFGGRDAEERLEVLRWLLFDNHKFTSCFATLRFLVGLQKSGETPVTEFLRQRALAGFAVVRDAVLSIGGGPLVSLAAATNVLSALTGSASGGMTIALGALGETYLALAAEHGIDPGLMHRVAAIGSGTLDALPHNGAIVTLLAVCGTTHRESYSHIVMAVILGPILALVAVIALGSTFGSF